jgi:DNA-binding NarL/FixJ family response regulator
VNAQVTLARTAHEVARLFGSDVDRMLTMSRDGWVTDAVGGSSLLVRDVFGPTVAAHLEAVLAADDADEDVVTISGEDSAGRDVALRVVRSDVHPDSWILRVRAADADLDAVRDEVPELTAAVRRIADIVLPLSDATKGQRARRRAAVLAGLTEREHYVASAVVDGLRTSQIASDLFVSQSTVRNHLSAAYRKLGVASRRELVDLVGRSDRLDTEPR